MAYWLAEQQVVGLSQSYLSIEEVLSIRMKHLDKKLKKAKKNSPIYMDLLSEWVNIEDSIFQDIS
jgi:hypothetical protein